jgi:hypothetical protein
MERRQREREEYKIAEKEKLLENNSVNIMMPQTLVG